MTGEGVGKLYLHGIQIGVVFNLEVADSFVGLVGVVLGYGMV